MERRRVIGITGHQQIPPEIANDVRAELVRVCGSVPRLTGVTCLAAGADQLFALVVLAAGGILHVIVPSHDYECTFTDDHDRAQFHTLIAHASLVEQLEYPRASEDAYDDAGHRVVDRSDELIAAWDGQPAKGKGGTGDIVKYARMQGKTVTNVWPSGVSRQA
jgi:hypothetical protein